MNGTRRLSLIVVSALALACAAWVVSGADNFTISRWTIDGGGIMFSTGANFELSGTIGQPDASTVAVTGGHFELSGGFWFRVEPGDCNSDGGVNLFDYSDLEPCLAGPDGGLTTARCACFDLENDEDVDLVDVARFLEGFSGS